jgi:hypothetical protein
MSSKLASPSPCAATPCAMPERLHDGGSHRAERLPRLESARRGLRIDTPPLAH